MNYGLLKAPPSSHNPIWDFKRTPSSARLTDHWGRHIWQYISPHGQPHFPFNLLKVQVFKQRYTMVVSLPSSTVVFYLSRSFYFSHSFNKVCNFTMWYKVYNLTMWYNVADNDSLIYCYVKRSGNKHAFVKGHFVCLIYMYFQWHTDDLWSSWNDNYEKQVYLVGAGHCNTPSAFSFQLQT